jgi:hypothetical protein
MAGKVVPLFSTASKPASLQRVLLDLELSQSEANQ